ncbi:hypothetical protein N0V93_004903 [Gnomoniopsis smithogilvyi]|uniref:Uncharacterized protein n=1 Tax=Gnomoniopsis smithogilvyi TaxID=1191159 RepID=A0A9W8YRW4_9PEZI|nr:hypothetical protein N0V93_004903 [Gnomoniopsis smithogilvyi]
MREESHVTCYAKMERVTAWVAECAAARQAEGTEASFECDGETEDLLLQVLIARPKYQGIPTVEEIQQFAGQLRSYNARLWTLGMTKGFFRVGSAPGELGWVPEYPDDIDSLESMSMHEEEAGINWMVHDKRVFVRKISPAEEELRDEMIQEYRNIRRHSVNDNGTTKQCRTRSVSAKRNPGKMDGFARNQMAGRKEYRVPKMAC